MVISNHMVETIIIKRVILIGKGLCYGHNIYKFKSYTRLTLIVINIKGICVSGLTF